MLLTLSSTLRGTTKNGYRIVCNSAGNLKRGTNALLSCCKLTCPHLLAQFSAFNNLNAYLSYLFQALLSALRSRALVRTRSCCTTSICLCKQFAANVLLAATDFVFHLSLAYALVARAPKFLTQERHSRTKVFYFSLFT